MKKGKRYAQKKNQPAAESNVLRTAVGRYTQGIQCYQAGNYDACCITLRSGAEALLKSVYFDAFKRCPGMDRKKAPYLLSALRRLNHLDFEAALHFDTVYSKGNKGAHASELLCREEAQLSVHHSGLLFERILGRDFLC